MECQLSFHYILFDSSEKTVDKFIYFHRELEIFTTYRIVSCIIIETKKIFLQTTDFIRI